MDDLHKSWVEASQHVNFSNVTLLPLRHTLVVIPDVFVVIVVEVNI